jgi:alpha-galactosidase
MAWSPWCDAVSATTCAGYMGSYGNEATDASQFVAWGFDFVKHDT